MSFTLAASALLERLPPVAPTPETEMRPAEPPAALPDVVAPRAPRPISPVLEPGSLPASAREPGGRAWQVLLVQDESTLAAVVRLLRGAAMLACDLETTGLDPHTDRIRLITLATEDEQTGVAFVIDSVACPGWATLVSPLLNPLVRRTEVRERECSNPAGTEPAEEPAAGPSPAPVVVFHHGLFDVQFLLRAGVTVACPADTLLVAQILDGGVRLKERGAFALATVVERELGERLAKDEQQSDWGAPELRREQIDYAARDALVLLPLYQRLMAQVQAEGLEAVAALECAALSGLAWLTLAGAPFDLEAWLALSDEAVARRNAAEADVLSLLTEALGANSLFGRRVNLDSPAQLKATLAGLGVAVDSTSEEALAAVAGRHPVIPCLLAYREAQKLVGTYGVTFARHVHPLTGRIHASYHQIGAATGRMSCSGPNLQQVPRSSEYRACFRPPAGRVLVKADLSLIELCVAAEISGDDRMIAAITEGQDLHRLTAAALFGKPPADVTKEERSFAKSVNFGTVYGQGLDGLVATAARHNLTLSKTEARGFQDRFTAAWPQLTRWRRQQLRGTAADVHAQSGRVRRLTGKEPGTVRANTPIQGTAADGFKAALALLWQTRARCPSAVPVLAVHDELVIECDERDAEAAAGWVSECLVEGMRQFLTRVPVRVEVTISRDWSGTPLVEHTDKGEDAHDTRTTYATDH